MKNDFTSTRVVELIKSLKINSNSFEKEVGWSKGMVQKIMKGGSITEESLLKVFSRYPQVNTEWWFRNTGNVLKSTENENNLSVMNEPGEIYQKVKTPEPIVITVDNHGSENILMVNSRAFAGYTTSMQEPEYLKKLPAFGLPLPEFKNATLRAFQASGQSMEPTIWNGDWLIGQWVEDWPFNIKDGYIYIVVTNETILVKRLLNRISQDKVIIQSDNESFATDILRPEEIQQLWYVKGKLSLQLPNTKYDAVRRISALEADIEIMKRQLGISETTSKGIRKR